LKNRLGDTEILLEIDFLIFHRPPQPLYHDVVHGSSLAIQSDIDMVGFELPGEGLAGILRALIGVEDLRRCMAPQIIVSLLGSTIEEKTRQPLVRHKPHLPTQIFL
jgi:hypothetical protein